MDKDTEKLLDEIKTAVRCQYLSDLHSTRTVFDARAKQLISEIPDNRYSTIAWSLTDNSVFSDTMRRKKMGYPII